MMHIDDDDMVLHFYGEGDDHRVVDAHLSECATCRARFDYLTSDMAALTDLAVPERDDRYGAMVWARLQPALETSRAPRLWERFVPMRPTWPGLALAGALATLVVAAFVAGRYSQSPPAPLAVSAEAPPAVVKERILLVAVGEHLSRSRVVLAELSNRSGGDPADISAEQTTAEDLIATSRLYRQTAADTGDLALASMLEQLERTLVEIANTPSAASADDLARLRDRIESQGLIFKVTVLESRVRQRQRDAVVPQATRTKTST